MTPASVYWYQALVVTNKQTGKGTTMSYYPTETTATGQRVRVMRTKEVHRGEFEVWYCLNGDLWEQWMVVWASNIYAALDEVLERL